MRIALAGLPLLGVGVPKDVPGAVRLLKRAAGLGQGYGLSRAHYVLATVYGRGYLGRPDYVQAAETLQSLPLIVWQVPPIELPPDLPLVQFLPPVGTATIREQRVWLVRAGESGHLESQKHLGHNYEFGAPVGYGESAVPKDLALSYFWYSWLRNREIFWRSKSCNGLEVQLTPAI